MRLTALSALLALALPLSAAAETTGLLDLELDLARNHFPVVILEIESGSGRIVAAEGRERRPRKGR